MKREYKISLSQQYYSDIVYLSQYDTDYPIIFKVVDKYAATSEINGLNAKFTGTRNDGLGFTFESIAVGGTVSFEINTSLTAVSGMHTGEIVFTDAEGLYYGSANVKIVVEAAARPDGTIDADVERAQEIVEQIQEIVDNAAATVSGEAEKWATGQVDGTDVPSTDPAYENNAKYYAEQAETAAASIGIDATLTQAGKAADAKVVGDEISGVKENLNIVQSDQEDHISAVEAMLSALCGILDNGVYITDQSDAIDALRNSLNPTGISIRYVSGRAVISRLNNTNISWTGTVASVGGSV